jgi:CubicO group peptidase (beta-lactamase class C family)
MIHYFLQRINVKKASRLFLFSLLFFPVAYGQKKQQKIDSLLQAYFANEQFNGAALVAEKGKIIYEKAFGSAVFEWGVPNTLDTKFRIASLSKQFTSLLIMQLVAEGKLSVKDPISKFLPDLPADKKMISIHQLLTHTSGLVHNRDVPNFDPRKTYSKEEYFNLYINTPLKFTPGTKYSYSSQGYNLLAEIIEQIEKEPFHKVIKKRIFDPAGMKDSKNSDDLHYTDKIADGYGFYFDFLKEVPKDPSVLKGSGGIITTLHDYFLYDRALRNKTLLKEPYYKQFLSPYVGEDGYSWSFYKYPDSLRKDTVTLAWYSGFFDGYTAIAYHCLEEDKLILLFFNVENGQSQEIADNLFSLINNFRYALPKKSLLHFLATAYKKSNLVNALNEYQQLPEAEKNKYDKSRDEINILGYKLLNKGMVSEAIELFKFNVFLFPKIGDNFDSLAEAFYKNKDYAASLANYTKALELDQNNTNARDMIEKIKKMVK